MTVDDRTTRLRLLVVDDDAVDRMAVRRALGSGGWDAEIVEAGDAASAMSALRAGGFDCAFVDYQLPGSDGGAVLAAAREAARPTPVVVLTGHGDEQLAVELMKAGAHDYISKAELGADRLTQSLRYVLRVCAAEKEAEAAARALRRRAEQLQALAGAALALNAGLSTDEVLDALTVRARDVIGAHQAVASLVPEGGRTQPVHAADLSSKYAAWRRAEVRPNLQGLPAIVCEENRPARMTQREVESHPRWRGEGVGQPPLRGWLAAPLVARTGRNLGLIQMSDKADGADFSAEDEAILVQLAQMASAVLENARLYEEAREAAKAREEVLAVVSHDLRTPLSVVSTAASVLADPDLPESRRRDLIERIERAVGRMTGLIRDLLDVARLEAGRLVIQAVGVEVKPLLDEVCHLFRLPADERSVRLSCQVADGMVPPVAGDRDRLLQVLQNLVDNALKFTPEGGSVRLWASTVGPSVRFSVADSGPGIPPDEIPHLFDRFWQARGGGRTTGGAGLGLAIVRGIVEAHGGTVWVESEEGRGTTFHFTLPAAPVETEAARAQV